MQAGAIWQTLDMPRGSLAYGLNCYSQGGNTTLGGRTSG